MIKACRPITRLLPRLLVISVICAGVSSTLTAQTAEIRSATESLQYWSVGQKIPTSGHRKENLKSFDELMESFLVNNQLPGATLAVSKNGKLVYSRGYGHMDVDKKLPMQPKTQLRIASISKPITSAAIFKLIDQKKLMLSDRVFEILPHKAKPGAKLDPRLSKITVQHCLQHSAGWNRQVSFDPMFRPAIIARDLDFKCPPGADNIVRYMLGQPLDHDPGKKYAYSNFGYCVLGRVIEAKSGLSYEKFVINEILNPLGISQMRIGKTLLSGRGANEAKHYDARGATGKAVIGDLGSRVPAPYGAWHLEAMDAHGGWVASAVDLVKFAGAFDSPTQSKILSSAAILKTFERPGGDLWLDGNGNPKAFYYAHGWNVRPHGESMNSWHSGLLAGTSTILVRRHDGLSWAVLFNSERCADGKFPASKIDPLLHRAANAVKVWP